MSLVAAAIEQIGIPTVVIQFLRDIAVKIQPPRALLVPFRHGYPLGEPHNIGLQKEVLNATLNLLDHPGPPPVLQTFSKQQMLDQQRINEQPSPARKDSQP